MEMGNSRLTAVRKYEKKGLLWRTRSRWVINLRRITKEQGLSVLIRFSRMRKGSSGGIMRKMQ